MKIAFHTLGCKVNQYESEAMAQILQKDGHEIVGEKDFADVYIVNTCTVTSIADKKSRQYIRRMKKVNPKSIVAVTGCYSQINPTEVSKIEGVDIITGTNEKSTLCKYIQQLSNNIEKSSEGGRETQKPEIAVRAFEDLNDFDEMGIVTSTENRTRAYIKVQEGCNRFCSYCVIPYARGQVRSRALEDIVIEAKALLDAGYKELVLTGINTAMYDIDGGGIETAISAINEIPGDFRIRLSSLEPSVVDAEYVKRLFKYDKLCHHLHMSAQSGSDEILKAMNRPYTSDDYTNLAKVVCDFDPVYGLSTDIIVGFPGEKEEDFQCSCKLVAHCAFCKTHVFKYSKRPLTKAANMTNQVSPQVKNHRADALGNIAAEASKAFFNMNLALAQKGRRERVLLEEVTKDGKYVTGYTGNYIKTYISNGEGLQLNSFVTVSLVDYYGDGMEAIVAYD